MGTRRQNLVDDGEGDDDSVGGDDSVGSVGDDRNCLSCCWAAYSCA